MVHEVYVFTKFKRASAKEPVNVGACELLNQSSIYDPTVQVSDTTGDAQRTYDWLKKYFKLNTRIIRNF